MFTGLVEEVGRIRAALPEGRGRRLVIAAGKVLEGTRRGDSMAVNGVCQTVTALAAGSFEVQAVGATLHKTTLAELRAGSRVNLERALKAGERLGGHFVQGHVSARGTVLAITRGENAVYISIALPADLLPFVAAEGSVALDGVSLTVAEKKRAGLVVSVIPHTLACTTLGDLQVSRGVNIEVDLLGRYAAGFPPVEKKETLTFEKMHGWGY
jgi:riboflavin synthase